MLKLPVTTVTGASVAPVTGGDSAARGLSGSKVMGMLAVLRAEWLAALVACTGRLRGSARLPLPTQPHEGLRRTIWYGWGYSSTV